MRHDVRNFAALSPNVFELRRNIISLEYFSFYKFSVPK